MTRFIRALALSLACAGVAVAQTRVQSPQRPARSVEAVRPMAQAMADAARLDELLARGLQRLSEEALPVVDDATFVRRAHLTLLGRIATLAETEAFLADTTADKRHVLVDRLLDGAGRTSHFANFWFEQLRVKSRQQNLNGEPFAHFLRESIRNDMPFDLMVREMLTAEGPAHKADNGATGMLMRDANMPHDAMANALRLFLGTRLECAQCHNHPFDHWTQKEFFEMAAFFGGIRYRDENALPNLVGLRTELAQAPERQRQQVQNLLRRMNQGLDGSGSGVERLPADYKYEDQKPGTAVMASTLFGAEVKLKYPEQKKGQSQTRAAQQARARQRDSSPEIDSRTALAEWMTSKKNPQFAKVIANRMWARTFGAGVVEPLDDWKKDTEGVHPELMAQLEKLMKNLDYDLRQFERVLAHTQLFQRESPAADPAPGQAITFRGPVLRRMTAEQMWDSLLTLVFDDVDDRLRAPDERAKTVYEQFAELSKADAKEMLAMVEDGRGNPMARMDQQRQEEARRQLAADRELQQRAAPLIRQLAAARREGDQRKVAEIAQQLQIIGLPLGQRAARGREGDLLRASDLTQPAAPNHLLRQFGQSDRETVDSSSAAATVPQVLTLLNGFLDQRVLDGASALRSALDTASDGERRVRIAFLTTLNREPSADEARDWRKQIAIHGDAVVKDLVWVLCNSNEFRFVR
ncbi:MAG: DUF1549 domain-containing protein [Planctomycetes bacterium]|nr:DUF1549 domain-containing protein [Planctomycetota bacterium]